MPSIRSFIIPAILFAAAPLPGAGAQESLKPTNGPWASLYVNYSGGWANRDLNTTFSVDRDAYVLVGHLGGNGEMTILFPSTPADNGFVRASTRVRTDYFDASHDGVPAQLAFRSPQLRFSGARLDSYDGRGSGFVFIVTSDRPMNFQRFAEAGEWQAMYVENFFSSTDPRWAVHEFADLIAGDDQYRLRFASATQSMYATRYASMAADCSLFSHLGFTPLAAAYFMNGISTGHYFAMVHSGYYQSSLCGPWLNDRWGWSTASWYRARSAGGYYRPVVGRHLQATLPTLRRDDRRSSSDRVLFAADRAPVTRPPRVATADASDTDITPPTRRARPVRTATPERTAEPERAARPERTTTTDRAATPERRPATRPTERARPARTSARTTERRTSTSTPRATNTGSGRGTKPRPNGDQR